MLGIYCRTSVEREWQSSTITQQINAGENFAIKNNLEFKIYKDEGKSGYKISDDDLDPFKNRPQFIDLINDIKDKKINQVWVWEFSRLSRNDYASAFILNVFEKYNVILFLKDTEYNLAKPEIKLNQRILAAIAEYERHLIVTRTTRGSKELHSKGRKIFPKLFCYVNNGKKVKIGKREYIEWDIVESEVATYKHILKRFNEGASMRTIVYEVYDMNKIPLYRYGSYAARMATILRKYQYTGYQLTEEGNVIYLKFQKYEIDNIQVLKDRQFWIKSIPYPLELIGIDEWVDVVERLRVRGAKMNFTMKDRMLRANKDIGTGLLKCAECGSKYYHRELIRKSKTKPTKYYYSYFHNQGFRLKACNQFPRSFQINDINEIMKLFYFYFHLVFDNRNELIKKSQKQLKLRQIILSEDIKRTEKNIEGISKQISKFQKAVETEDDIDTIKQLAKLISQSNDNIEELNISLSEMKIEYENVCIKYSQNMLEITYYDVKEKIMNWFTKLNIEEQRNELIKSITSCKIYNRYMVIESGNIVFLFNIHKHYIFDMELLNKLDKDLIFKEYFVNMTSKKAARKYNEKLILNINLNIKGDIKVRVFKYLARKFNIYYDFVEKTNLVSFVPLTGLQSIEVNLPD